MKILCLNGWGGREHAALLAYLRAAPPDVLCLQEVIRCDAPKAELTYRDEDRVLSQRSNFFGEVAEALGDHDAYFAPASTGPLWDDESAYASQWGLATYVRRTLPLLGFVQGFVHGDYAHEGFGAHPRPRTAQGIRVYHADTDSCVSVLHMHGLRDARGKIDTPERAAQAERFLSLAGALSRPGDVCVLCGDFNVLPESETLRMLSASGFTELVSAFEFPTTRSPLYEKPNPWADYMLINRRDAVADFEVVYDPVVSDHCPLALTVSPDA